jgi:hypothetical protein
MRRGLTVRELLVSLERKTIVVSHLPFGDSHEEKQVFEGRDGDGSDLTFKHDLGLIDFDTGAQHLLHGWKRDRVSDKGGRRGTSDGRLVSGDLASRHEQSRGNDGRREEWG